MSNKISVSPTLYGRFWDPQTRLLLEPDPRIERLAELRIQLRELATEIDELEPGSPEQREFLERWVPLEDTVLALADELSSE